MDILEKVKTASKTAVTKKNTIKKVAKPTIVEVFTHSKPKNNNKKSRTTIAGIINYKKQTISIHGARNNTKLGESFKRIIGRQVALGRAKKHPLMVIPFKGKDARQVWYDTANALMKKPYRINDDPNLNKDQQERIVKNKRAVRTH